MGVDAAGNDEQATGVEFTHPGHRSAELSYLAVPDPDVADLTAARSDDRPATDDKVEPRSVHLSILTQRILRVERHLTAGHPGDETVKHQLELVPGAGLVEDQEVIKHMPAVLAGHRPGRVPDGGQLLHAQLQRRLVRLVGSTKRIGAGPPAPPLAL